MHVLLDTNVFTKLANPAYPQYSEVAASIRRLERAGRRPCLAPQNVYELWVVLTRPLNANGLGMDAGFAFAKMSKLTRFMRRLEDGPSVYREWIRLVRSHSVCGKPAHDARLVAIMNVHNVDHLVTFNTADFARYSHLTVWTPAMVP